MRFHVGFSFTPKQVVGLLAAAGAVVGGLIAGGVIPV